ncbi:MAG: glutamine synthetase family protein [Alphaproteobacteria bacterium]|nr:glutamine synthetase family protein [Alphaproteobacteria bacterium]
MLSRLTEPETTAFLDAHPEVEAIELLAPDMNGLLRGKRLQREAFPKLLSEGVRMPGSIYLLDSQGQNAMTLPYGSADGDPDFAVFGAAGTLSMVPWAARPTAQVLGSMVLEDGAPWFADPRHILSAAAAPLQAMGLTPVAAIELEFYLLSPRLSRDGAARPARMADLKITPGQVQVLSMEDVGDYDALLADIAAACNAQGLKADVTTAEYGPGQFEINLTHVADPVSACDRAVLFKRLVKSVARKHGVVASFMAKPFAEHAGSGLHVHLSLIDTEGRNIFAHPDGAIDPDCGLPIDARLRHAIGGLRETMAESIAIMAPNANSYRRFRNDSFAPINRAWGVDNRTVSLRIPRSDPDALRIEHRAAGADANPYLALAAILAGVHYGLTNKIDPGPMEIGNAYERPPGRLPLRWERALDAFEDGAILKSTLGAQYHAAYLGAKQWDSEQHHAVIPRHDYEWYMRTV